MAHPWGEGEPGDREDRAAAATDEHVLREQGEPSWLPAGSRVQWVVAAAPPSPMGLVRLLIREGDRVFCVPRERGGRLDLPTRAVGDRDPGGWKAIGALSRDITGSVEPPRFVGAVRNIVPDPAGDPLGGYEWPAPVAHFGVWQTEFRPRIDGRWLDLRAEASPLRERHWHPLIALDPVG
ncbi:MULTISPECIES: NUDIX hydrolase [unclassified Microbacterium]|uniref:NUDIX hydrolase n=1 Tax=unclassified Microbacterium TaxID=2609290 RepID=UPI003654020E